MKLKTTNKISGISKIETVGFYYKIPIVPPTLPKIVCLIIPFLLPKTPPFLVVPSHIIMVPKTTRIENSN
jgi:hypothetical protein